GEVEPRRQQFAAGQPGEVGADGAVVGAGAGEGGGGEALPGGQGQPAVVLPHLVEHLAVLLGGGDHGHVVIVLGGGAQQGGAADVDVLDDLLVGPARPGDGGLEGVEVDHHQVDRLDAVLGHGGGVLGIVADVQDAAVDARVQGLDPPVEH